MQGHVGRDEYWARRNSLASAKINYPKKYQGAEETFLQDARAQAKVMNLPLEMVTPLPSTAVLQRESISPIPEVPRAHKRGSASSDASDSDSGEDAQLQRRYNTRRSSVAGISAAKRRALEDVKSATRACSLELPDEPKSCQSPPDNLVPNTSTNRPVLRARRMVAYPITYYPTSAPSFRLIPDPPGSPPKSCA